LNCQERKETTKNLAISAPLRFKILVAAGGRTMSIYLDSANPDEVRQAMALGFVAGITTNPLIIAREKRPAPDLIAELLEVCPGTVFYQLTSHSLAEMRKEAEIFHAIAPNRLALKIPCTFTGLSLVAELSSRMTCAVTAIFTPGQTLLATEARARYIIPYVNRMTRLLGDGILQVSKMAEICRIAGRGTEVIAASLKSIDEVVEVRLTGAQHVTVPWNILQALAEDSLSYQAIEEFDSAIQF
jgi:transaldolase